VEWGNRLTAFGGYQVEYDADGNVTRKYRADGSFDQRLFWNSLGQLDSVWTNGIGTLRYGYDGWGRRVRRTDQYGGVMRYLYDGHDLLMETDAAGSPIREYTYYPGIDEPHSLRRSSDGAMFYYLRHFPGDVAGLIDGANQLANHYRYRPFGTPESGFPKESTTNPLRFQAREIDGASGLYYFRNRWYDPSWRASSRRTRSGWRGGSTRTRSRGMTRSTTPIRWGCRRARIAWTADVEQSRLCWGCEQR
jgi:YD repeat-containing protein